MPNLDDKKQVNIYVPRDVHEFLQKVAKKTSYSVGELYCFATMKLAGINLTDDISTLDPVIHAKQVLERLYGNQPASPMIKVETTPAIATIQNPARLRAVTTESSSEIKGSQKKPKKRTDSDYRFKMNAEAPIWNETFQNFSHLARVTSIRRVLDENDQSNLSPEADLFVISFQGYYNPNSDKIASTGYYKDEPLLDKNKGYFITTLICADPYGDEVLAGRSIPSNLIKDKEEGFIRQQATGAFDVMFFRIPDDEISAELSGYCAKALNNLRLRFDNFVDRDYLLDQLEELQQDCEDTEVDTDVDSLTFDDFLRYTMLNHYLHLADAFERFDMEKTVAEWTPKP